MPERSFTFRDQEVFAALSRDFNPMHVDPEAARRLPLADP
jgi:acyl dehydratase